MTLRKWRTGAALSIAIAVLGAGCTHLNEETQVSGDSPAEVTPIPGEQDLAEVSLTLEAAENLGLETRSVTMREGHLSVPSSAVQYLPDGEAFVYTSPEKLTYLRAAVEVIRDDGPFTSLSKGPEPGTQVVAVGAPQLLGTEFQIDGEG